MIYALEIALIAVLFVGTGGAVYSERGRKSSFLLFCACLIAVVYSIYSARSVMSEWFKDVGNRSAQASPADQRDAIELRKLIAESQLERERHAAERELAARERRAAEEERAELERRAAELERAELERRAADGERLERERQAAEQRRARAGTRIAEQAPVEGHRQAAEGAKVQLNSQSASIPQTAHPQGAQTPSASSLVFGERPKRYNLVNN